MDVDVRCAAVPLGWSKWFEVKGAPVRSLPGPASTDREGPRSARIYERTQSSQHLQGPCNPDPGPTTPGLCWCHVKKGHPGYTLCCSLSLLLIYLSLSDYNRLGACVLHPISPSSPKKGRWSMRVGRPAQVSILPRHSNSDSTQSPDAASWLFKVFGSIFAIPCAEIVLKLRARPRPRSPKGSSGSGWCCKDC